MAGRLRDSMPFSVSALVHGLLLGALASRSLYVSQHPGSVYDQEIRPYEKRLVFYNLRQKLPDVSPGKPSVRKLPLRASKKFAQPLVAGEKDLPVPPQLIRVPQPKIELPRMLQLPNVVAAAPPPRQLRRFAPPPPVAKPLPPAPDLPAAPQLAAAVPVRPAPFDVNLPKPQPRAFTPPPSRKPLPPSPSADLPAPELRATAPALHAPVVPRGFNAPPPKSRAAAPPAEAPPPPPPEITGAAPAPAALAIVGLDPVNRSNIAPPPGSHDAGFSAGPELHPKGAAEAPTGNAAVTVPGLVTRGGAKEAPSSLLSVFAPLERQVLASARAGTPSSANLPAPKRPDLGATHVSSSPDPRMNGRYVYTMAIQMPNVTSYSGSWIVWFADRDPVTHALVADLHPPVPVRKVDPKYIQTAVEEKVEGVVRLSAVIRRDGHVHAVELLQHLDERLDRSAEDALSKWEFEPAMRDGAAVEVDAVFEIPFRLAPKSAR